MVDRLGRRAGVLLGCGLVFAAVGLMPRSAERVMAWIGVLSLGVYALEALFLGWSPVRLWGLGPFALTVSLSLAITWLLSRNRVGRVVFLGRRWVPARAGEAGNLLSAAALAASGAVMVLLYREGSRSSKIEIKLLVGALVVLSAAWDKRRRARGAAEHGASAAAAR